MRRRHVILHREGLTLIEILISAAILGVSLLAIATMFPTAMEGMEEAGNQTRAFTLARGMLERIRGNESFADVLLYDGQSTAQVIFNTGSAIVDANLTVWKQTMEQVPDNGVPQYVGQVTVTVTATPARLATVTVEVQWPNDRSVSAALTTQISES